MFSSRELTVNQWIGIFIVLCIPFVNCIVILVWAFSGSNSHPTLKNLSRAMLKLTAIAAGLFLAVFIGLRGNLPAFSADETNPVFSPSSFLSGPSSSELQQNMHFTKLIYRENYGMTTITGEVTNETNTNHSFTYIVTFYGDQGRILGTATGIMDSIGPNQTKTFETETLDNISTSKSYRVDIDSVVN